MQKFLVLGLLAFQCILSAEPLENYFSYLKQLSYSNGNYNESEIEIAVDPIEISKIQQLQETRLLNSPYAAVLEDRSFCSSSYAI